MSLVCQVVQNVGSERGRDMTDIEGWDPTDEFYKAHVQEAKRQRAAARTRILDPSRFTPSPPEGDA